MFDLITKYAPSNVKNDILAGLTVALALVPEAVAFAFAAHVVPLVGLYAAFIMGLVAAIIGGRAGMITGATGAVAVVIVALVDNHGVEYLFAAVVLAGLIQITIGLFKLGKFIRLVPYPVFLGFVNGLALVILIAQFDQFKQKDDSGNVLRTAEGAIQWLSMETIGLMFAVIALTMAIIHFLPRLTKAIPSTLVAIVVGTLVTIGLGLNIQSVGDISSIKGNLPDFHIPSVPFDLETFKIVLPYAITVALVGLIESLLTLNLVDELTETRGQPNRECVGQGVANTITGFFGGMGGCAMVGQSIINIKSGGRGRLSGISAALFLLSFILVGSALIEQIPVAVLIGVMFMVVIGTFEWSSFRLIGRIPPADTIVGISVALITVFFDLAIAVIVGVILSAVIFAWQHAKHINATIRTNRMGGKVYELNGPLFFASVQHFQEIFDPKNDPDDVVVDFKNARVADHSAIQAIDKLAERYLRENKRLHLKHLSPECRQLLKTAGDLVEVNIVEDPTYHVAVDKDAFEK